MAQLCLATSLQLVELLCDWQVAGRQGEGDLELTAATEVAAGPADCLLSCCNWDWLHWPSLFQLSEKIASTHKHGDKQFCFDDFGLLHLFVAIFADILRRICFEPWPVAASLWT